MPNCLQKGLMDLLSQEEHHQRGSQNSSYEQPPPGESASSWRNVLTKKETEKSINHHSCRRYFPSLYFSTFKEYIPQHRKLFQAVSPYLTGCAFGSDLFFFCSLFNGISSLLKLPWLFLTLLPLIEPWWNLLKICLKVKTITYFLLRMEEAGITNITQITRAFAEELSVTLDQILLNRIIFLPTLPAILILYAHDVLTANSWEKIHCHMTPDEHINWFCSTGRNLDGFSVAFNVNFCRTNTSVLSLFFKFFKRHKKCDKDGWWKTMFTQKTSNVGFKTDQKVYIFAFNRSIWSSGMNADVLLIQQTDNSYDIVGRERG